MRPEIKALLIRWREVLAAAAITLLGAYWALTSFGPLSLLGWTMVIAGLAFGYSGAQRARARRGGEGPGVVTIDERRVTYLGPLDGGVADLDLLARLELAPGGPHWRLIAQTGARLDIPVDARGADQLLDLFAALPGLRMETLLRQMASAETDLQLVWHAGHNRLN